MDIWDPNAVENVELLPKLLRLRARDFVKGLSPEDRARLWLVLNTLYNPYGNNPPEKQALINECTDDLVEAAS